MLAGFLVCNILVGMLIGLGLPVKMGQGQGFGALSLRRVADGACCPPRVLLSCGVIAEK